MERVVVDTNVATTANGANPAVPADCVAASARALADVMRGGHVFVDDAGSIVAEYRSHLSARGQPGPGDAFLRWILTHEWGGRHVTRVTLTPSAHDPTDYQELPAPPQGVTFDPADRKFLAVAAAHDDPPTVLQSFDSKWWGWRHALADMGVDIYFICPEAIRAKHDEKFGP